jgi:protein TilB
LVSEFLDLAHPLFIHIFYRRYAELHQRLREELRAEGIDPEAAAAVENQGEEDGEEEVAETGVVGEDGEMRRPWCPATRILEHRETERQQQEAEERKK